MLPFCPPWVVLPSRQWPAGRRKQVCDQGGGSLEIRLDRGRGRRPPTIREVAQLAGTSIGTVSRVINGATNVAPEMQLRVRQAIAELGYRPSAAAQSLRTASSRLVACMMPDLFNPISACMVGAAEQVFAAAGYTLMMASTQRRPEREIAALEALGRRRVDGLLAMTLEESSPEVLAALRDLHVPVVLLERDLPLPEADRVVSDHARAMQGVVELLFGLGHRRIALIAGIRQTLAVRERVGAFHATLVAHGITPDPELVWTEMITPEFGFRATRALMTRPDPPTAIIAAAQPLLAGALRALRHLRLSAPRDVSLIAWGDSELAELGDPPVTVVRFDAKQLGVAAAQLLLRRLRGAAEPPKAVLVQTELVLRSSCGPPPR